MTLARGAAADIFESDTSGEPTETEIEAADREESNDEADLREIFEENSAGSAGEDATDNVAEANGGMPDEEFDDETFDEVASDLFGDADEPGETNQGVDESQ